MIKHNTTQNTNNRNYRVNYYSHQNNLRKKYNTLQFELGEYIFLGELDKNGMGP